METAYLEDGPLDQPIIRSYLADFVKVLGPGTLLGDKHGWDAIHAASRLQLAWRLEQDQAPLP
jgi:hypothetical protein